MKYHVMLSDGILKVVNAENEKDVQAQLANYLRVMKVTITKITPMIPIPKKIGKRREVKVINYKRKQR